MSEAGLNGEYQAQDCEDYGGFDLDWQEQRQAEWQERIQQQYFSRWSVDKLDEWQAYQARFDAAHDGGMGQANLTPPQRQDHIAPREATKEDTASGEEYRKAHEMQVISAFSAVPLPVRTFEEAGLPASVFSEVHEAGFVEPTPIQAQCWPILGAGHDLIGIAKSGSGKTLAFLGPGFAHVLRSTFDVQKGPMVLVLAPTRELARQIQLEALKFGRSGGILCCAVSGGEPKGEQLEWVKRGCHVIVATPGRLNEFLERRHVWLGQVGYVVLDEADRMLDMGFEPQIRRIIEECPKGPERQTLLFSATWPKAVRQLAFEFLRRPLHVHIGEMNAAKANTDVDQRAIILDRASDKDQMLLDTLKRDLAEGELAIIFVSTKKACQEVSQRLQLHGFGVAEIHGDKDQRERDVALHSFVNMQKHVLVATDVASRGLDIKGVKWVVNYDAANTPEDHVHRIGRTGRAGEKGISYTFLVRSDAGDVRKARAVVEVMETAGQEVPTDLRQLAGTPARRGGGGKSGGKRGGGSAFKGGAYKGSSSGRGMSSKGFFCSSKGGGAPKGSSAPVGFGGGFTGPGEL
jgi:ATP-dependent RNA helicase DDX5/DBP2